MTERLLTIGQLAERTGLNTSALRYYDEVGLLEPTERVSGRRMYSRDALGVVGAILLLRDVDFSLDEIREMMQRRLDDPRAWRRFTERKLGEIDRRIDRLGAVREALSHALQCPADDIVACPTFRANVELRLEGVSIDSTHHPERPSSRRFRPRTEAS